MNTTEQQNKAILANAELLNVIVEILKTNVQLDEAQAAHLDKNSKQSVDLVRALWES